MSCVTNVVVHVVSENRAVKERLLEDLGEFHQNSGGLNRIDYWRIGGAKAFEDDIYVGAFNYLDTNALLRWWDNLPWGIFDQAIISVATEGRWVFIRASSPEQSRMIPTT